MYYIIVPIRSKSNFRNVFIIIMRPKYILFIVLYVTVDIIFKELKGVVAL